MTRKLLSLVTAIGIAYVYLQSQLHSGDALFLIASDSLAVNFGLLILAASVLYVGFIGQFKAWYTYLSTALSSVVLSAWGLIGVVYAGASNNFTGIIKPLDYMIMLQVGIIFGICALSYRHQPLSLVMPKLIRRRAVLRLNRGLENLMPTPASSPAGRQNASTA